jgi:NAD(P)-dependent dehydrogenase (short-subunit alcohol dehydrogenase family)
MSEELFPNGAVLVVGGSGGIGRYVCQEFARAGTDVALTYRSNKAVAEETAQAIRALGRKATIHQVDTAAEGQVDQAVEAAAKEHGRIHTVVYGAAPLTEQLYISEFTPERWKTAIDQEVHGFFKVVHATPMFIWARPGIAGGRRRTGCR